MRLTRRDGVMGLVGGMAMATLAMTFTLVNSPSPASLQDRIRADLLDASINKPWNGELGDALYKSYKAADRLSPKESAEAKSTEHIMLEEMQNQLLQP